VGLALGLLGGGGSILTLPILLYALHMEEKSAIATSLLVVGATSVGAVVTHARAGNVRWRTGAWFAGAGATGALLGGLLSEAVPAKWLMRGFLFMMLGTAFAMIRGRRDGEGTGTFSASRVVVTGSLLGVLTGMVGAGGGFVIVPALVLVGGLPMRHAVGTSLLVIATQSFAGFVGHATHVPVDYATAGAVIVAAIVGSVIGGRFAQRIPALVLRRAFGVLVLFMAAYMGWMSEG